MPSSYVSADPASFDNISKDVLVKTLFGKRFTQGVSGERERGSLFMDSWLGLEDGEIPNSAPYENFDWYLSFLECDIKFQAT